MPNAHMLSIPAMRQTIATGGSVLWDGKVISRVEELPTELQLAGNDKAARSEAKANLKAEIARLQSLADDAEDDDDREAEAKPVFKGRSPRARKAAEKKAPETDEIEGDEEAETETDKTEAE